MNQYDPKKIEEYQMILIKNPRSPVFAALSETYRKMGLLEEALETSSQGIRHNPEFVSGLVAHAKVLYDLKDFREALTILKKACALKPENILALRLQAYCHIKLKQQACALKSFKKLLVLNPKDEKAIDFIKQWEFLDNMPMGSEFEQSFDNQDLSHWIEGLESLDQAVHIVDTFIAAENLSSARQIIAVANLVWPQNAELLQRQKLVNPTTANENHEKKYSNDQALQLINFKKEFYEACLQRIGQLKRVDHPRRP